MRKLFGNVFRVICIFDVGITVRNPCDEIARLFRDLIIQKRPKTLSLNVPFSSLNIVFFFQS